MRTADRPLSPIGPVLVVELLDGLRRRLMMELVDAVVEDGEHPGEERGGAGSSVDMGKGVEEGKTDHQTIADGQQP